MKFRLFTAIDLPPAMAEQLADYGRKQERAWPDSRWTAKRNLHLTTCFMGDVDEAVLGEMDLALKSAAVDGGPFVLTFSRLVLAPPGKRLRSMIWAEFKPTQEFEGLAGMTAALAVRLAPSMPPVKEARPHVTLSRFRRQVEAGGREAELSDIRIEPQSFTVSEFVLYRSRLSSAGAEYEQLARFSLGPGVQ